MRKKNLTKAVETTVAPNPKEVDIWVEPKDDDTVSLKYYDYHDKEWKGGSEGGSKSDAVLSISQVINQDDGTTSFGIIHIDLNTMSVINEFSMPPYTIEKQQENTWKITIVDVKYYEWSISCTAMVFSNVINCILVDGSTEASDVDRVTSPSGGTVVYGSPNDSNKFVFWQYDVSTDTEYETTILFERQFSEGALLPS